MKQHIENTRRQLGELGAMATQNEAAERKILDRARALLSEVEGKIDGARRASLTGGREAEDQYMELVQERGRLHQVIAQAQANLAPA